MLSIHTEHLRSDVICFPLWHLFILFAKKKKKKSHCATGPDKDVLSHRKKPSGSQQSVQYHTRHHLNAEKDFPLLRQIDFIFHLLKAV